MRKYLIPALLVLSALSPLILSGCAVIHACGDGFCR